GVGVGAVVKRVRGVGEGKGLAEEPLSSHLIAAPRQNLCLCPPPWNLHGHVCAITEFCGLRSPCLSLLESVELVEDKRPLCRQSRYDPFRALLLEEDAPFAQIVLGPSSVSGKQLHAGGQACALREIHEVPALAIFGVHIGNYGPCLLESGKH